MKTVFYKKVGRRYEPVSEYDNEVIDSFTKGHHLVSCNPGITSRRYDIDPNYAALIAAGMIAEDIISKKLVEASALRPSKKALTDEQYTAWKNLQEAFGQDAYALEWPSAREASREAVEAMQAEAMKLLSNPCVKKAYDHFILICKLTKEGGKNEART